MTIETGQHAPEEDNIEIQNRQELLAEDLKKSDNPLFVMAGEFLQRLALDRNVGGAAITQLKLGGIYVHLIVKDFKDHDAMRKTLDTWDEAEEILDRITDQPTGAMSYIEMNGKSSEDFAVWFKEEFYKPPKFDESSDEGILNHFQLAGSTSQEELLGIIMFED